MRQREIRVVAGFPLNGTGATVTTGGHARAPVRTPAAGSVNPAADACTCRISAGVEDSRRLSERRSRCSERYRATLSWIFSSPSENRELPREGSVPVDCDRCFPESLRLEGSASGIPNTVSDPAGRAGT
jgi:hypothetical protein